MHLKLLSQNVNEIRFVNCPEITDMGIRYLAKLLEKTRLLAANSGHQGSDNVGDDGEAVVKQDESLTVKMTNCPRITEASLVTLSKVTPKLKLEIQACDIGFVPESVDVAES